MAPKPAEHPEFTAKSVEEALAMASESLGIPEFRLDYQVVRDNSRTLFGLVRTGDVTIRVMVPPERPQPSVSDVVSRLLSTTGPESVADNEDWDEDEEWVDEEELDEEEQADEEYPDEENEPVDEDEDDWDDDEEDEDEPRDVIPASSHNTDDSLEGVATEVIATLLDKMGILAAVEISDPGGESAGSNGETSPLVLNLVGDDLGILIGRRGETLRDLQFITRLIVSRRMGEWPNLVVDVEGYKSRRTRALRSLARRMADQVRRTHQPVVLEPMPANERRIVHLALRDDDDVYTESTGQDDARKVQILPKREH